MSLPHSLTSRTIVTGSRRIVALAMAAAVACSLVLELCRPLFFLRDDNLVGGLPILTEMNRRLWSGAWPFVVDGFFGGQVNLLADPNAFSLLSPWNAALSWLSLTAFDYWLIDAISIGNALTIAAAFSWSACWMRERFAQDIPDWLIVTLSTSYAFTPYHLIVGANWLGFVNAQAALPLAIVGMLHPRHRHGILLIAGGTLYALCGGHAHVATVYCLLLGALAVVLGGTLRQPAPLLRLAIAGALVGGLTLPVLWNAIGALRDSARYAGLSVFDATNERIGFGGQALGYLVGPLAPAIASMAGHPWDGFQWIAMRLCLSMGNLLAFRALLASARLRPWPLWVRPVLVILAMTMLWIARPMWLAELIAHVPLLRSLRLPFREVWIPVAFLHYIALWGSTRLSVPNQRAWMLVGTVVTLALLYPLRGMGRAFPVDRQLIASGAAGRYWRQLQAGLPPQRPRLIVGGDSALVSNHDQDLPHAVLGTFNFPSLFNVTSESGFTILPAIQAPRGRVDVQPVHYSGVLARDDAKRFAARYPGVWLVLVERVDPVEWSVTIGATIRRFRFHPGDGWIEELRSPLTMSVPAPAAPSHAAGAHRGREPLR